MDWKAMIWRRGQQIFGALVATCGVSYFLYCIILGHLPGDLAHDLPYPTDGTAYQISAHDPRIDDGEIKQAIGLCREKQVDAAGGPPSIGTKISDVPRRADTLPVSLITWSNRNVEPGVSSFELSAVSDSARISADRLKFEEGTREKQDRIRRYQVSVLLLTAAASFLIGVKTLLSNNDATVSFPSIMQGAWLPISVAALLVPVVATVYSGIIAFDDDSRVALRYARALAQLEQLHGRIVVDVAGDPLLCGLRNLDPNTYAVNAEASGAAPDDGAPAQATAARKPTLKAIPANAYACLLSHEDKVKAWGQRYEQIMNDASQTLAQAGDLARGDNKPTPAAEGKPKRVQPTEDACAEAFNEQEAAQSQPAMQSQPGVERHTALPGHPPVVAAATPPTPKRP